MKILKYIFISSLLMALAISCQKGLDPINAVTPGADTSAPAITISYPLEGTLVRDTLEVSPIIIKLEATDDIELKTVSILIDGTEDTSYTSFKDYRRAVIDYSYFGIALGDHILTVVATDMTDKSTTQSVNFKKVAPYAPMAGEVFYMPFDGDYVDLVNFQAASVVGTPGFAAGKVGQAYAGALNAYLQFPTAGLKLGSEFSATFWYKLNPVPGRSGIFVINPVTVTGPDDGNRNHGIRVAREPSGANENIFANIGIGTADIWMNPFYTTASDSWMHIAISISATHAAIYVDGTVVKEAELTSPLDWAGCPSLSIASGAPNFIYWEHFSDVSLYDELRIFNKALTLAEVTQIYHMKK